MERRKIMDWLSNIDWAGIAQTIGLVVIQLILIWIGYLVAKSIGKHFITRSFDKIREKGNITKGRAAVLVRLMLSVLSYSLGFIVVVVVFGYFELPISDLFSGAGVVGYMIVYGR